MALKEMILAEFDHEVGTTRRLLDRLPDARLSWKPHDKSWTLGGLATHIGNLPNWASAILTTDSFDLAAAPPHLEPKASRADILAFFDGSTKAARALMDKTDAEWLARWTLSRGGQEVFSMPRVSVFRSFVLNHLIHHRGQLSIYLRLNDIPVPAIYGPTADEG